MANDQGTWLAYLNAVESGTITTDADVVGDRLVTNLATTESDDSWRFLVEESATSATVTVTWTTDQTVGAVSTQFPRHEYTGVSESNPAFLSTDTIRYRLYDSEDTLLWDSTEAASGVAVGYMIHQIKLDTQLTNVRKLVADYDAASRETAGFCDVGTLGAWKVIEPNVGFSYPGGYGWKTNMESQTTTAGRRYNARFDPMRRWTLIFDFLTNSEAMSVDEMIRYSGGARQVLVCRGDLPSGMDAMHATLEARDITSRTASLRQAPLTFEEFI